MQQLIMGAMALCGAIGAVVGMAFLVHWGRNRDTGLLPYYFYPGLFLSSIDVILSNRDISIPVEFMRAVTPAVKSPLTAYIGKGVSLFLLTAVIERILHYIFNNKEERVVPGLLLFGMTVFFLTNVLSPGLFGAHPSISHEYFYSYFACTGSLLMNQKEAEIAWRSARNGFYFFLLAGLALMIIKPSLVMSSHYVGIIPFLKVRLAGLANHANALGVLALLFMLAMWRVPFSSRLVGFTGWMIGYANLILAQSKTCWIAFFLAIAAIMYANYYPLIKKYFLNYRAPHVSVLAIGSGMLVVTTGFVAFMFFGLGDRISTFFTNGTGAELASFTGRDIIWQIAKEEWHRNPIFGYGLTIWDEDFRKSINMANATSAHNQFYQSLSMAGVVGFVGLITYVAILMYMTTITYRNSKGYSLALFFILMTGCFSEVPLLMESFGASPVIGHSLLLIVIGATLRTQRANMATKKVADSVDQMSRQRHAPAGALAGRGAS